MDHIRAACWIAAAVFLAGCGGGGGAQPEPVDGAPVIANLRFTPASELQLPGETATITATLDFTDSGRNVAEWRLTTSAGANQKLPITVPVTEAGTLSANFSVPLDQIGSADFELWLVDSAGQVSNRLSGGVGVLANDTVPRWRPVPGQAELARLLAARGLAAGAWSGSQYLFVGGGVIVSSPDLLSWTEQTMPTDAALSSVAWSGSAWVAVGSRLAGDHVQGVVLQSIDGKRWTVQQVVDRCPASPLPPPPCTYRAGLSKVLWAGVQFVAVGRETVPGVGDVALVLTSPDGLTWTQRAKDSVPVGADIDGPYGLGLSSLAWSGSQLVAVGRAVDGGAAVWTSSDAQSWTERAPPDLGPFTLRDVAWGLGRFVAVGWGWDGVRPTPVAVRTTATLTSTDGIGWQAHQGTLPLSSLNAIGVGPARFLTASTTGWHSSTDGRQWLTTLSASAGGSQGAFWDGQRWVGVGAYEIQVSP